MSRLDDHRARWLHNRAFMSSLSDEFPDWMVTASFYAAVHAIGTLLAADGAQAPTSHTDRFRTLKAIKRYQEVFKRYRPLYDASQASRYECDSKQWVDADAFRARILPHYYFPLEKSVVKLLGDDAPELPVLSLKR